VWWGGVPFLHSLTGWFSLVVVSSVCRGTAPLALHQDNLASLPPAIRICGVVASESENQQISSNGLVVELV